MSRYHFKSITAYSDSMVVLFWIKGFDKQWKDYIHNRVSETRGIIPPKIGPMLTLQRTLRLSSLEVRHWHS